MSTISGLSSSTVNDIRGYGGLASGLDRDTLIEQMTYGTQSKIDSLNQKLELEEWTQEAIRAITTSMNDFNNKYMSYSSTTNLFASNMYSYNSISSLGDNADSISVSGSGATAHNLSILGIKQLASDAIMTTSGYASERTLSFNSIGGSTLAQEVEVDTVRGKTLQLDIDGRDINVILKEGDYSTIDSAIALINESFEGITISDTLNLSDLIEVQKSASDPTKLEFVQGADASSTVTIKKESNELLKNIGFDELEDAGAVLTSSGIAGTSEYSGTVTKKLTELLGNATLVFDYNGTTESIKLDEYTDAQTLVDVQNDLQSKLDDAFGKDRVRVGLDGGAFSFETTVPGTAGASGNFTTDQSSVIKFVGGGSDLVGKNGLFGVLAGESNRINMTASFHDSGLLSNDLIPIDFTTEMIISNNDGTVFDLRSEEYGLTEDSSINRIIETINGIEELGIQIIYQETMDKFTVKTTEQGSSGVINLSGNVANALFGGSAGVIIDGDNNVIEQGKDAIVTVSYGSGDSYIDLVRGSNTIEFDGLDITLEDTFGEYDATTGEIILNSTDAITFDASVDTNTTADAVESMINDYNAILELINNEISTRYDRDYQPLTPDQRAEMSDDQIADWEEQAKEGLLFADSDLRMLLSDMRFLLPLSLQTEFSEIGISTSTNWEDNGKIIFDRDKFETALSQNPNNVMTLMTNSGSSVDSTVEEGLVVKMQDVIEKYAGMTGVTKGILVERAGSVHSPTSIISNTIQDQIDDMNESIEQLEAMLESETDRYISQFTELETLISQMNSQSSLLSNLTGGM